MLEQHEKLMQVRDVQLQSAQADLARRTTVRDAVNQEVALVDAALRALATQRACWDEQWQAWIQHGGALQRGKAYADQHLKMAALENDLAEERAEIVERLQQAQEEVDAARTRARKRLDALSQITDIVGQMKKRQHQQQDAREVQRTEDAVAVRSYLARKTLTREARHE